VATGLCRAELRGHGGVVHALAFRSDGKVLASGGADGQVFIRYVTGLDEAASGRPAEAELTSLWQCLAGEDSAAAYRAVWRLRAAPEQATALLRQRLAPPPSVPAERIERWLRELDADEYKVREKATRELARAGSQAEAALRRALDDPSAEVRRRAEQLLHELSPGGSPEEVRRLRAVEVLEGIGTPGARELLAGLARGAPGSRSGIAAQDALDRLARTAAHHQFP
jgi:hypothetical protein